MTPPLASPSTTSVAFARAKEQGRAALVGYLPAGYPTFKGAVEAIEAMIDAGCDIIEIGLPYSDPVMDGPTVAKAAQQSLDAGIRTGDVFRAVEAVANKAIPVVVMTYWNPVERYGVARFAADLASAGGAGLITPDIIPEEAGEWIAAADDRGLDKI
ncbi:MAG TPA: tryptophan synthase subunit alpha, partial [Marmoricola sp.]|nr:tryptophan synthase subunit alpha [Marmoricola sp.]